MKWLSQVLGGRKMATLKAGTQAPQFELAAMDGSKFSLQEGLAHGPVLAVFFKVSCPVCQYAFPYFERLYQAYGNQKFTLVGVSQNDRQDTAKFAETYGVSFPLLLEDMKTFLASNAYRLTTVPSAFWISEEGEIEISSVGWVRHEFEEIARKAASAAGAAAKPVFQPGEQVADFRAG